MSIYSLKIRAIFALTVSALLSFFSQSHAATLTWDANGTTALQTDGLGDWLNADQWWNGSANVTWTSGDDAVFGNGGAGGAVTLATPTTINSITFNPFTGTYTIGTAGQTITLNNGITMKSGAGIVSIISPITLGGAQSWTNNSASLLTIGTGAVTNGGFLLTIGGTGNTTISSAIDGSGGLTKSGSGILTLSEVNTYSGTTTVNAGTLALSGNGTIATSTGLTLNGGGLTLTNTSAGDALINRVSDSASIISNGGSITVTNTASASTVYSETMGALDLRSGQLNVTQTNANTTPNQTLTFGSNSLTNVNGAARTNATTSAITFSGTSLGLNAKNSIIITGQADSAVGEIIGPWATWGTTAAAQTDYATYNITNGTTNAFGIQNANIAATADSTWTNSTKAYTNSTASLTLGATVHNMLGLRNTGATTVMTIPTGGNLNTYGLLNGVSSLWTVAASGTGALSTPTGGGNLFVTTGSGAITVSAPITDNAGPVTLVAGGSSTLTLSGTNTFTGGLVLNAGTVAVTTASLNNNAITVNGTATLIATSTATTSSGINLNTGSNLFIQNANTTLTVNGVVTGSGALSVSKNGATPVTLNLLNSNNDFSGAIFIGSSVATNINAQILTVNSIGDSVASAITFGYGNNGNDQAFIYTGPNNLVLNNRYFEFGPVGSSAGANGSGQIESSGSGTLTISKDLVVSGTGNGAKTLTLRGSNAGNNTFAGKIADGVGTPISITKSGTGIWVLSGANTYTGATAISGGGALRINTINDVGGGASAIGAPTTAGNGTIAIGSGTTGGALVYTGTAFDTDRVINLAGTTGGAWLDQSGTGLLKFSSNFTATVAGAKTLTLQGSTTGTGEISGAIVNGSGTTSVAKSGRGTWTLSGTSNYTGTTSVSNGTLILSGSLTGSNVSTTSIGVLDQSAAGVIAGAAVTFAHGSTLTSTLAGTNTYGGATTITAGVLRVNGSTAGGAVTVSGGALGGTGTVGGAVTVSGTGGINLSNGSVGTLTLSSTLASTGAAGANNLTFDLGNTTGTSDRLSVTGTSSVTTSGAAVITLNQLGGAAGRTASTYTLIGGAGTLDATNFAKFSLATTKAFGQTYSLVHDAGTESGNLQVTAANVTASTPAAFWSGATNANWNTASNWKNGLAGTALAVVPDYETNVTFSATGAGNLSNQMDADFNINSLNFNAAAGGVTIASTALKMLTIEASTANGNTAGSGINSANTSGTNTISTKVGLASSQTWSVATGGTLAVSGVISDFGGGYGLTKEGGGILSLSGVNTFTGPLTIANGTVMANGNAIKGTNGLLGAGTTVVMGASGQTGRLAVAVDGGVTIDKDITLAAGGTGVLQFGNFGGTYANTNADRSLSLTGNITGSGNFVKLGGAAVVISGNNTYTGTTTVNEGALRLNSATALPGGIGATGGTSALTINGTGQGGAVIQLTAASGDFLRGLGMGSDQFQITGGISGFDANGSARQVIVGNNAAFELQWGNVSFNPSELLLGYHSPSATGTISLLNKIDLNGATRTVTVNASTATLSGDIRTSSGSAGLTKTGAGTLILSGSNTYNGATTISAGTLTLSSAGAVGGTSQIVLNGTSTLHVNAANLSLAKLVTGGGVSLGTFLRYSQAQTAAGSSNGPGTILGTVELNASNVNPDYTLDFGGSISALTNLVAATYNSPITLSGSSPSIVSSTAVFTGGTGMTIGASTAGAKTLFLTGTNTGANTLGGIIGNGSGTVAVTKTGGGTWALTGTNTYSGATTVSAGTLTLSGANGSIGSSAVTIAGGTLTISNANAANNSDRVSGSLAFTMNGGTFNYNNDASANSFSESAGSLTLIGGANTVAIQQAAVGRTSTLTFAELSRIGGTINFSGAGLTTTADPRSTITFTSPPTLTNGIIGYWATVNGTNYATLDGSNNVVAYGGALTDVSRKNGASQVIPDSATADVRIIEGTGTLANLTLAGATTTTIRSLLNSISSGTSATTIDIASGKTLLVDSINSVPTMGALTLGTAANTGTLTSATAGGNLLLINSSTNNMTVNSVIANNTSASSITKDGAGAVILSGTNTYSGGTVINAGTLAVKTDANLGAANTSITFNGSAGLSLGNYPLTGAATINLGTRPISINNAAVAGLYHNWADTHITVGGAVTGDGGLNWGRDPLLVYGGGSGSVSISLNSTGNTFTGPITVGIGNSENAQAGASSFNFSSLGDSANPITFNFGGALAFRYNASGPTSNLSLASRPINLLNSNTRFENLNATYTMTLGAVSTSTAGAKTLNLSAGGAGGTIAGNITNGNGTISVDKTSTGTWALGGTNTYSGSTTIRAGAMTFQGRQSVSPNSPSVVISESTARFLDDGSGTVSIPNTLAQRSTQNGGAYSMTIFVGNNNTANGGTSGGTTTGSTIAFSSFIFDDEERGRAGNGTINITGANGYRLQLGSMSLGWRLSDGAAPSIPTLNPTTAPLTISGTVIQRSGNTTGQAQSLILGGTATDNLISGAIMDAADFPSNANARALNLIKSSTSNWTLSGANTYTGVTTVSGGILDVSALANGGNSSSIGASTSAAGNLILNGGTLRYTGASVNTDRLFSLQTTSTIDASGTGAVNFTNAGSMGFNGGTATKTLTLTGSNTGDNTIAAVIGDNTGATTLTKTGVGTWVLAGTNSYSGINTITAGVLGVS
ncbi:MAG: beta strand repeat-containing protein, partial [Akkermansiaceae bacterium]